jgi:hypothetical protein
MEGKMKRTFRTLCLSVAFLCLLGISAKLDAGVIMISPCAFKLHDTSLQDHYLSQSAFLYVTNWDAEYPANADFFAPLNLPQGVIIKKMTVFLTDNGSGPNDYLIVFLKRANAKTGAVEVLAGTTMEGGLTSPNRRIIANTTLSYATIDNRTYSYNLDVRFPYGCATTVMLHAVKIEW